MFFFLITIVAKFPRVTVSEGLKCMLVKISIFYQKMVRLADHKDFNDRMTAFHYCSLSNCGMNSYQEYQ